MSRLADEAVHIGPAPAARAICDIDAIIEAAQPDRRRGDPSRLWLPLRERGFRRSLRGSRARVHRSAGRGHPRDGLEDRPPRRSWRRGRAGRAGLSRRGSGRSPRLQAAADQIGYPVLIKASAGGGGKGMRVVGRADELADALASARREAQAAFGDDRVLIEKYVASAASHRGPGVRRHARQRACRLFERDCSLQRRHQKVIEEAPAPGLTPERRAECARPPSAPPRRRSTMSAPARSSSLPTRHRRSISWR